MTPKTILLLMVLLVTTIACGSPAPNAPPPDLAPATPPEIAAPDPGADRSNRYPSDVLDLKNWYLTLPTGKPKDPDTVEQPALARYRSEYFRLDGAGTGVVFRANAGGVTTKGSKYPRSELREMAGEEKASWSNGDGTHTMTVRQAVTRLPPAKPEIVAAQIHDADDDVLLVRVEGNRLIVRYDDGDSEAVLDPAYRLGTVYELRMVAAGGRVEIFYNGVRKAEVPKSGSGWYFKTGAYLQSNPDRGDAPDAVGEVVIYGLRVEHSR
ncbi:polysaccharide lyase family 7 protein [Pseudonocardia eucalypti]|uniref:Polysaccharide lyase family 7 protein n=1 Tax=Pseudonocardia eucalypti TaxID=648755 RepID=A0ABP9QGB9_9PSEU|nr:hypothetical protein [Pseudonocardia eucalypti]